MAQLILRLDIETKQVDLENVRTAYAPNYPFDMSIQFLVRDNWWTGREDEYGTWDASLNAGRRYLVGKDTPIGEFLRRHRSPCTSWQKTAFLWARCHPDKQLIIIDENKKKHWSIYARGEFVEFGLPHHRWGGERHYITRDGHTKVCVNID